LHVPEQRPRRALGGHPRRAPPGRRGDGRDQRGPRAPRGFPRAARAPAAPEPVDRPALPHAGRSAEPRARGRRVGPAGPPANHRRDRGRRAEHRLTASRARGRDQLAPRARNTTPNATRREIETTTSATQQKALLDTPNASNRTRLRPLLVAFGPGNGTLMLLPIDQGVEHGPRDFFGNPAAKDPEYHFKLAVAGGYSAIATQIGFAQRYYPDYAGQVPLILKLNGRTEIPPNDNALST